MSSLLVLFVFPAHSFPRNHPTLLLLQVLVIVVILTFLLLLFDEE